MFKSVCSNLHIARTVYFFVFINVVMCINAQWLWQYIVYYRAMNICAGFDDNIVGDEDITEVSPLSIIFAEEIIPCRPQ